MTDEREDPRPNARHVRFPGESEAYLREWRSRVDLSKKIAANLQRFSMSGQAALLPAELRSALADLSVLVVYLAQESHGKFDQFPFDLPAIVRRLDAVEGLTGSSNEN